MDAATTLKLAGFGQMKRKINIEKVKLIIELQGHFKDWCIREFVGLPTGKIPKVHPYDNPKMIRKRLEEPELKDILILKSRGLSDKEIIDNLGFSIDSHGGLNTVIENITIYGYSLPKKEFDDIR